jgi:hypothetical protein
MAKGSFQCARHDSRIWCGFGTDRGETAIHNNADEKLVAMNQNFANEDMLQHQTLPDALSRVEVNG